MFPTQRRLLLAMLLLALGTHSASALAKGTVPALELAREEAIRRDVPPHGPLNTFQKRLLGDYLAGTSRQVTDTLRVIGIQVQFADSMMGGQPGGRPELRDSTWFANEFEHVADYFRGASLGHLQVRWTVTGKLYTLSRNMGYYGNDDFEEERVVKMVQEVIELADDDVDFASYDLVSVIKAGAGQETDVNADSRNQIWSSFYDAGDIDNAFPDSSVAGLVTADLDGGDPVLVDNFAILPANSSQDGATIGSLGIWAFEIASRVGLVPLFDSTPAGFVDSQGIGNFDLMAYGLFNANGFVPGFPCAFNRLIAGWVDPVRVDPGASAQQFNLRDINTAVAGDTACLKIPITDNEYYLVVNRVHDANFDSLFTFFDFDNDLIPANTDSLAGADFDFFLTDFSNPGVVRFDPSYGFDVLFRHTGSGIYVWHVDENVVRQTLAAGFLPNDFVDRKGVDLEEADGVQDMDSPFGAFAFAFGSHFDSFRDGDGNATGLGPDTKPSTAANSGALSGVVISGVSAPGPVMSLRVGLDNDYVQANVRWLAAGAGQPASVVDLDGAGNGEIAVLAADGLYAFAADGAEFDDSDADPSTIAPFIPTPDIEWAGPPAFGDLDAAAGIDVIAADATGRLYAWRGDGTELADGDNDPGTDGVLFAGMPLAAPPVLLDIDLGDNPGNVLVIERIGDSLRAGFVDHNGNYVTPANPVFADLWPVVIPGQHALPPAIAVTGNTNHPSKTGVVFAWADTVERKMSVSFVPARFTAAVNFVGEPPAVAWKTSFPLPPDFDPSVPAMLPPAVGDIDADSHDEVVVTLREGALVIIDDDRVEMGSVAREIITLGSANPSAVVLGDADLDGTLEIALWDDAFLYLLDHNGRAETNWPKQILPELAGEQPPNEIARMGESPLVGDLDGDGEIEVLFPTREGAVFGYNHDGTALPGFPRVAPAGMGATPTVAALEPAGGALRLIGVGHVESLVGIDAVVDSLVGRSEMSLSIQQLAGSDSGDRQFWSAHRGGLDRSGRVTESLPLKKAGGVVSGGTFMIYPNPVSGEIVHARVTLNARASVRVEVYNLEGERAFSQQYVANDANLINTPFDEVIDVGDLKSGVYFMRVHVEGVAGSESLVGTFAIKR